MSFNFGDDVPAIEHQDLFRRAGPIPDVRLAALFSRGTPTIVARAPDTTTSSSDPTITSCGPKDTTGPCERMVAASGNTTLPIVLGVAIPLTVAFVVLIILHRRHVKKLRREDAEDADKSLDFGLGGSSAYAGKNKRGKKKGGPKIPEMSVTDAQGAVRRDRGVSLDLGAANPYLLPPELQSSRESLHSLSRSMNTGDDKYRATTFVPDDGSIRSPSSLRSHWDDASTMATSSSKKKAESESTKGHMAQPLIRINEISTSSTSLSPTARDNNSLLAPGLQDPVRDSYLSTTSSNGAITALRASNNYLGQFISGGNAAKKEQIQQEQRHHENVGSSVMELEGSSPINEPPPVKLLDEPSKRKSVLPEPTAAFNFEIPLTSQEHQTKEPVMYHELATKRESQSSRLSAAPPAASAKRQSSIYDDQLDQFPQFEPQVHQPVQERVESLPQNGPQNQRRSVLLPAEPEYAQNRESEYYDEEAYDIEEYAETLGYDPRMLGMGQRSLPPDDPSENPEERALKIRSFYKEYFDDSTKPAGAASRVSYYDGSENYVDDYYRTAASSPYSYRGPPVSGGPPYGRHRATVSTGTYRGPAGPRAYSSASGQIGHNRPPPRKNLPPPAPLLVLPTPSRLQEDSMLPNAIDFAPPQVFKNQRSGTPDSLKGGQRPYSPARAFNPLVSSFDDLAALPSPHALRKSGTFTSLDFAPPRFAPSEANASDAGSIRSTRSGVSAVHQHNIRNGAYRVSRIPKEVAGTRDEMSMSLRPQWDMNRK